MRSKATSVARHNSLCSSSQHDTNRFAPRRITIQIDSLLAGLCFALFIYLLLNLRSFLALKISNIIIRTFVVERRPARIIIWQLIVLRLLEHRYLFLLVDAGVLNSLLVLDAVGDTIAVVRIDVENSNFCIAR